MKLDRNVKIAMIIAVITTVMVIIGGAYAFFTANVSGNETASSIRIDTASLSLVYNGSSNVSLPNALPGSSVTKTFTVENNGSIETSYNLYFDEIINTFANPDDLVYTLSSTNNGGSLSEIIVPSTSSLILSNIAIGSGITQTYTMRIWFKETGSNQNDNMGKEFNGKVKISVGNTTDIKVTGSNPITLLNSKGNNLLNYKIYGNSIQEGDPTPANPIPIYSLGEEGKNLFNPLFFTSYDNYGLTIDYLADEHCFVLNGTTTAIVSTPKKYINIPIVNGSTFTITSNYISGTTENLGRTGVAFFGANDEPNISTNWKNVELQNNDSLTTSVCNYDYITSFWFYIRDGVTFNNYKVKIQLEKDSISTNYEPYNTIEIKSSGKNLFDKNELEYVDNIAYFVNSSPMFGTYSGARYYYLKCKPNTTYTFSQPIGSMTRICSSTSRPAVGVIVNSTINRTLGSTDSLSITTGNNDYYLGLQVKSSSETNLSYEELLSNIQLELGEVKTSYEPYHEPITTTIDLTGHEALRKVGDVADYIDYANSQIVRNIGKFIISNNSKFNGVAEDRILLGTALNYVDKNSNNGMSPIWNYSSYSSNYNYCHLNTLNGIFYWYPDVRMFGVNFGDNNDNIKNQALQSWLQSQSNENKTVYYQLATPTYEPITLPQIPTYGGTTIISIQDNLLKPSNIELDYQANIE